MCHFKFSSGHTESSKKKQMNAILVLYFIEPSRSQILLLQRGINTKNYSQAIAHFFS